MQLFSVNISARRTLAIDGKTSRTGIFKEPVSGPVVVGALGLAGDFIGSKKHHGGPDQAVYLYGVPEYAWWATQLGRDLAPGTFGENLTVTQCESVHLAIGDRFHIGEVVLEVSAPRIPCRTLAGRMGDEDFVARFVAAERPGVYCRVLREGILQAGDTVRYEPVSGDPLPVLEVFRDFYRRTRTEESLRRILAAPIAARVRARKQAQWDRLRERTVS